MSWRRYLMPSLLVMLFWLVPSRPAQAQLAILEVIKAGVKKVIKAADLRVQRLQNETIWLQNAQKVLENSMSKLKLTEIADWTDKQRELYRKYYEELWRVKAAISYYRQVKDITQKQLALVAEYKRAWALLQKEGGFHPEELEYMGSVYSGILEASLQNLDQIIIVTSSAKTQMTDAQRLDLIAAAAGKIDDNYDDLRRFNQNNLLMSLQKKQAKQQNQQMKTIYGIAQ